MRFILIRRECKREYTQKLSAQVTWFGPCTTEMTLQQPTEGSELLHLVLHQPSEEQLCEVSLQQHEVQQQQQMELGLPLLSETTLKAAIIKAAIALGYKELKDKQEESIMEFAKGRDVFVSLPTGYGKSLCYVILPSVFDELRKSDKKSIVLVVSPLIALMKDQVNSITAMGLSAIHISDRQFISTTVKQSVKNGEYQLIFISPEALICCMEWRSMLSTKIYQNNLVAFVIDEAHCIKKWYVASHELGWVAQGQIQGESPGGQDPPLFLVKL